MTLLLGLVANRWNRITHTKWANERTNESKEMSIYDLRSFCQNLYEIYSSLGTVRLFSTSLKTLCGIFFLSLSSDHNPHAIVVLFLFLLLFEWISTFSFTNWTEKKERYIKNTLIGFLSAWWIPLISIYIQTISELDIRDKRLCYSEQVTYDIFFLIVFSFLFLFSTFVVIILPYHIDIHTRTSCKAFLEKKEWDEEKML